MAENEGFKRNVLLGMFTISATAAGFVWWMILNKQQQPQYGVSPEASDVPGETMLPEHRPPALAGGDRSPFPVRAAVQAPESPKPVSDPSLKPVLNRVDLGARTGRGGQWSGAQGGASSLGDSGAGGNGAGGDDFPSLGQGSRWELTAGDVAALRKAVGHGDSATLGRLASDNKKLFAAFDELMDDPRALHWLMSNKTVEQKFMQKKATQDSCAEARFLARSLSNAADESGLHSYVKMLAKSVGIPGSTIAIVDSRIHQDLWSQCPSFMQLAQDPVLIGAVMSTAPEFMSVMTNPAFATALQTSPR